MLHSNLICWDFEGCGLHPLQVGVARLANHTIKPLFFSNIFAPKELKIPWQNPASNLDRDQLAKAPRLCELWPSLQSFWSCDSFVSHNKGTERKYLGAFPLHAAPGWIDTLVVMRFAYPCLEDYSLGNLLNRCGLYNQTVDIASELVGSVNAHHPVFDACGSLLLLKFMTKQPGWETVTVQQLQHLHPKKYYQNKATKKFQ